MKLFLTSIFLMCLIATVVGDGCNVQGKQLKVGEKYSPPGQCIQITCNGDGETSGITCGLSVAGPNCKLIPTDNSKPYPECCEKYKC